MAQAEEKILVSLSSPDPLPDHTLYALNPDGSDLTRLFDFHDHPEHKKGGIWQPRVAPDGDAIYCSSDNSYLYTPARRNLFRIPHDGSSLDQITPGPNSGLWDQPGPYGSVEGTVRRSDGTPWGNSPVFLEGAGKKYSQPDGSFRFENVPEGERWIVAYRPGDTPFDAQVISVVAGTTLQVDLQPYSDYRANLEYPVAYGERIYYRQGPDTIQWTEGRTTTCTQVYQVPKEGCVSLPTVEGFDVAPISGRLAIADYHGDGCLDNRGLYLADKDGNDRRLLVDMMADYNWCGVQEVFWSADEQRIVLKACYNWQCCLMVLDLSRGQFTGWICFDQRYTLANVALHGWSPDRDWLLCSYWLNQQSEGVLSKIRVNDDGSLDAGSVVNLLTNVNIAGATWGMLAG